MREATIDIDGMTCGGCVNAVKQVLSKLGGISSMEVVVGRAKVAYDDAQTNEGAMREAIRRAGFTPR